MVHAADRVAFDPAGGELRAAMRAAEIHDVRRAVITAVKRKALAHDLDRLGLAGAHLLGAMNRMPKSAHECTGETSRASGDEILVAELFVSAVTFTFGLRHFSPRVFANLNSKSETN